MDGSIEPWMVVVSLIISVAVWVWTLVTLARIRRSNAKTVEHLAALVLQMEVVAGATVAVAENTNAANGTLEQLKHLQAGLVSQVAG